MLKGRARARRARKISLDLGLLVADNVTHRNEVRDHRKRWQTAFRIEHYPSLASDNNTLHTEPRAARLLETMIFAAAR